MVRFIVRYYKLVCFGGVQLLVCEPCNWWKQLLSWFMCLFRVSVLQVHCSTSCPSALLNKMKKCLFPCGGCKWRKCCFWHKFHNSNKNDIVSHFLFSKLRLSLWHFCTVLLDHLCTNYSSEGTQNTCSSFLVLLRIWFRLTPLVYESAEVKVSLS